LVGESELAETRSFSGEVERREPGANFSYIFFRGKLFSAENSVDFVGKNDFSKLFSRKIQFFPTFWGEKFSAEFSPEKMNEKSAREDCCYVLN
jgi:hypothetical protein